MSRSCQRCGHNNTPEAKFCLQCGAMLEMDAAEAGDPLIGKILEGRYRILDILGEGGMGKVYVAEQKMGTATRKVAVKTLHPELSGDPQLVARFHRESATVIELQHPNTINFYDFGELDDKTLFIVMEFIEGESLAHALQRGALEPGRVDKILIQICGSLNEAHNLGIVHRDLKPENVLLTDRGGQTDFVKVLDFGIAKRSEAEDERNAKLTKQGMVLGTPPYMSPEQFSGQALDARSDIYSLGVMTYEMLTGQLPFDAKTPWEWATKHLTAQPKPLDSFPNLAHVPDAKKNAIMRSLAKNRDERHATVLDFLQEFTGYQDAQAAWTMATSSAAVAPRMSNGAVQARPPVGTPGPMPQSAPFPAPSTPGFGAQTPAPFGAPTPAPFGAPTPNPGPFGAATPAPHDYASGTMEAVPGGGGAGKIVAVLVILMFVLGGGAAGGLYWWMQQDPGPTDPVATNVNVTPLDTTGTGTATPINGTPMVPSTPTNGTGDNTTATPTNGTPTTPDNGTPTTPENGTPDNGTPDNGTPDNTPENGTPETHDNDPRRNTHTPANSDPRGMAAVSQGNGALDRNDLDGAIAALSRAQGILGRTDAHVRRLRSQISSKGNLKVGILLQQGRCPDAQALYRRLASVGAQNPAGQQFSPDWCARP